MLTIFSASATLLEIELLVPLIGSVMEVYSRDFRLYFMKLQFTAVATYLQ